jgi:hypothetical protein
LHIGSHLIFHIPVKDERFIHRIEAAEVDVFPFYLSSIPDKIVAERKPLPLTSEITGKNAEFPVISIYLADVNTGFKAGISAEKKIGPGFVSDQASKKLTDACRIVQIHLPQRKIPRIFGTIEVYAGIIKDKMVACFFVQASSVAGIDQKIPSLATPVEKLDLQARTELMVKIAVLIGRSIPVQIKSSSKIKFLFRLFGKEGN